MNIATRLWSSPFVRSLAGLAIVTAPVGVLLVGLAPTEGAGSPAAVHVLGTAVLGAGGAEGTIDPSAVVGSMECVKCHKSEHAALMKSKHHESSKLIESGANVAKYQKAAGSRVCIDCHATPQGAGAAAKAISSVSCESCHGGAGGGTEWLKLHATEGITDTQRKQCDEHGMIRATNVYAIARNCTGCHLVSIPELVNAGHPVSTKWDFEIVGGSSGEVRHNFQVDQTKNAVAPSLWMKLNPDSSAENRRRRKYLVGMLVDLEVTLNLLKAVPAADGKTDFAKGHAKRLKSVSGNLEDAVKALGADAPTEVAAAWKAIDDMGSVSSFNFKSQKECGVAAPVVAAAARAASENYDGSTLGKLDAVIKKEVSPRGDVFTP